MKSIAIYCGSSDRINGEYLTQARAMGAAAAQSGLQVIYGAGSTGMMGEVANGALEAGGEVIGIMPEIFDTPQLAHNGLTRYEVVPDMHSRKGMIADLADGFIALPGGYGTMDEFFEILTWSQIGIHHKPIGLLNTHGYFDSLLKFLDEVEEKGFAYKEHRQLFHADREPGDLLAWMKGYSPPEGLEKWVERDGG